MQNPSSELIVEFESGVIPPTSRIKFGVIPRPHTPFTYWKILPIFFLFSAKLSAVLFDVLKHLVFGPKRKTWNVKMTVTSCFGRDMDKHAHMVDVAFMRRMLNSEKRKEYENMEVKRASFTVKKRDLGGILSDLDTLEDGKREVLVDWHECNAPLLPVNDKVIVYLNGGAYYLRSEQGQAMMASQLALQTGSRVLVVHYRLAPECVFPGALHDAVSAYFHLIVDLKISPQKLIFAGDSAGGALALALVLYLRDHAFENIGGVIGMSPWVDLTLSCPSWTRNASVDIITLPGPSSHLNPVRLYLTEEGMKKHITSPYASPIYGNWEGIGPKTKLLIQYGDAEVLMDEIEILLERMRKAAGLSVKAERYEDAVHAFQTLPFLDQTKQAFREIGEFVSKLDAVENSSLDAAAVE